MTQIFDAPPFVRNPPLPAHETHKKAALSSEDATYDRPKLLRQLGVQAPSPVIVPPALIHRLRVRSSCITEPRPPYYLG